MNKTTCFSQKKKKKKEREREKKKKERKKTRVAYYVFQEIIEFSVFLDLCISSFELIFTF